MGTTGDKQRPGATVTSSDRPKCGAQRLNSDLFCTRPAGWGTTHAGLGRCRRHGGSTPTHQLAAQRELARQAVIAYGLPQDIPTDVALLEEVARTAGHVQALAGMVAEIPMEDLAWGISEQTTKKVTLGGDGEDDDGVEGVVTETKRKAAPHVLINMYLTERKHLVDVCKTVAGLEIEDRRVKLAEQQGALLATVVRAILGDLELSPDQWSKVPEVVPRHLRSIGDSAA